MLVFMNRIFGKIWLVTDINGGESYIDVMLSHRGIDEKFYFSPLIVSRHERMLKEEW